MNILSVRTPSLLLYNTNNILLLVPSNTALSYQMMIEERLMSAMINGEQRSNFAIACSYAISYCRFLQIPNDKIPKLPVSINSESNKLESYLKQYFLLLDLITETASAKIAEVRKTYGKKSKDLIK